MAGDSSSSATNGSSPGWQVAKKRPVWSKAKEEEEEEEGAGKGARGLGRGGEASRRGEGAGGGGRGERGRVVPRSPPPWRRLLASPPPLWLPPLPLPQPSALQLTEKAVRITLETVEALLVRWKAAARASK